jgi:hypothetical protein
MSSIQHLTTALRGFTNVDVGYRTKVYSDIHCNVVLCALQSDIGRSDIRLSLISLITDITLSAHLWLSTVCIKKTGSATFFLVGPNWILDPCTRIRIALLHRRSSCNSKYPIFPLFSHFLMFSYEITVAKIPIFLLKIQSLKSELPEFFASYASSSAIFLGCWVFFCKFS